MQYREKRLKDVEGKKERYSISEKVVSKEGEKERCGVREKVRVEGKKKKEAVQWWCPREAVSERTCFMQEDRRLLMRRSDVVSKVSRNVEREKDRRCVDGKKCCGVNKKERVPQRWSEGRTKVRYIQHGV